MLLADSIAPHFFQPVKPARLGLENMDYNIDIIDKHPLQRRHALVPIGNLPRFLFDLLLHEISDCTHLYIRTGFTNHKKIGDCLRDFSKIQGNDIFSFFPLDSLNHGFKDFTVSV